MLCYKSHNFMFDIYYSVYNFHRHKFQGVASEAGPRTSTSGGQRCLRLQPTQTIQVTSARERSILTNRKQHQYHYCVVTFLYFLHVRIFVQLLMALSFTRSEVHDCVMSHPTLPFSRQATLLWYSAYHSFNSKIMSLCYCSGFILT